MATAGHRVLDRTGQGEHLPPGIGCHPRRDQRPRPLRRFHHHRAEGQPGEDPVAAGELLPSRSGAGREFADGRAGSSDACKQACVAARKRHVRAGAEDRDGQAADRQRAVVGSGIDAGRQAAADAQSGGCEGARQFECMVAAARCRQPAADQRHRRMPQRRRLPGDEQGQGRARDPAQQGRVVRIVPAQQPMPG